MTTSEKGNDMHFGYTIIYVADVPATLLFYHKAFGLEQGFLHESAQYGELVTGDTKLAFASEDLSKSNDIKFTSNRLNSNPAGFEIALVTEDVSKAFKKAIDAGALSVQEPKQKPWGQTVAYVRDLNGVLVEICSPMG